MSWWEIQVYGDSALEDLIFWRLEAFGCRGTSSQNGQVMSSGQAAPTDGQVSNLPRQPRQEESRLVRAYLPQNQADESDLAALGQLLRQDALGLEFAAPEVQWTLVNEEDWANSWKQYWQPQTVGDRFLIYPAWLETPQVSDRLLLRLDPGVAFGTGAHATTQLCLEAVEQQLGSSSDYPVVADIGCGSGILSIGAVLLGASVVYAVDTDPLAVQSTQSNRDLNQIDPSRIIVEQGSIERIKLIDCPVDGMLCNILAEVIINLVPQMNAISKPTTWGILSGILVKEAKQVIDVLIHHGWIVSSLWQQQDWCCLNVRRA